MTNQSGQGTITTFTELGRHTQYHCRDFLYLQMEVHFSKLHYWKGFEFPH